MSEFIDMFADEDRIADLERKLVETEKQNEKYKSALSQVYGIVADKDQEILELATDNAYASRLVRRLIAAKDHVEALEKEIEKLMSMVYTH